MFISLHFIAQTNVLFTFSIYFLYILLMVNQTVCSCVEGQWFLILNFFTTSLVGLRNMVLTYIYQSLVAISDLVTAQSILNLKQLVIVLVVE